MAHLTGEQRDVISALRKRGGYNAQTAHKLSQGRKDRYGWNRKFTPSVEKRIGDYLQTEQWSPEQIAGYCKVNNIEMVCTEHIYQFIRENKLKGASCIRSSDRVSKQIFIAHLPKGKIATEVSKTIIKTLFPYKKWVLSITFDNGLEFADHKTVAENLEAKTFFPIHMVRGKKDK